MNLTAREVTVAGYLLFLAAGAILEVLARRAGSRIPTLGAAMSRAMRSRSARVGIVAGWAWLGLHFFAR
jgi:hypothetical protein